MKIPVRRFLLLLFKKEALASVCTGSPAAESALRFVACGLPPFTITGARPRRENTRLPAASLRDFLSWWLQQLASLAPAAWRAPADREPDAVLLRTGYSAELPLEVATRERGRVATLGVGLTSAAAIASLAGAQGGRAVCLRLPDGGVLERGASLPLLAERDAAQALAYEIDRLTPFTADEVFWSWTVASRDRAQGRLRLRLAMVPRAGWASLIEALGRAGVAPDWIEGRDGAGMLHRIPLGTRRSSGPRLNAMLGAACVLLALVALLLPLLLQSLALDRVEARIAALRPSVGRVEAVRREIAAGSTGSEVILAERARLGSPLQALATITDILPDDTYLSDFAMHQRKLTLNGQSAAATRLIGLLSSDPSLRDPSFVAPVTRSEGGGADLFSIRTEFAGTGLGS